MEEKVNLTEKYEKTAEKLKQEKQRYKQVWVLWVNAGRNRKKIIERLLTILLVWITKL